MNKIMLLVFTAIVGSMVAQAQVTARPASSESALHTRELLWQRLGAEVTAIQRDFDGVMGVVIRDLTDGRQLLINPDDNFPTASSIKVPVLAELYRQSQTGQGARLTDIYTANAADIVPDSYIMENLTPGVSRITNRDVAGFMVAVSDNSAANVLIDRVGMENVNRMLDSLGLHQTRLRRKMMDLRAAQEGRENISTPREMAALLEAIFRGRLLNPTMTDDFFKLLSTPKDSYIPRLLPEDIKIANKPGSLAAVRTDSGIVFLKQRPFVISVMTSYAADERTAEVAISRIALLAFRYFDLVGSTSDYGRTISPRNSR